MKHIKLARQDATAILTISRGKVNPINAALVSEMTTALGQLEEDQSVTSLILTGDGKFFSFGLDVPELLPLSPEEFSRFLHSFCALYREIFLFGKPVVAAINGHATAGGCILALACDYRLMIDKSAVIGLNEVALGASLFAGTVEMLRFAVGSKRAQEILLSGRLYQPQEALDINLIDSLAPTDDLHEKALSKAHELAQHFGPGFTAMKMLVRQPIANDWDVREEDSIRRFVEIWYSPATKEKTRAIQIKD